MPRGEILEQKTEAYIGEVWYTIARNRMTYNAEGKRITSENLAGQVTTTAWDCCHKVSEVQPDGSTTTWDYDDEGRVIASSRLIPLDMTNITWLTTCYEYDAIGRQTGYIVGGQTVSYAYDPVTGRLISVASGTNEFFYTYLSGTDLIQGYVSGDFSHTVSYESSRDLVSAVTNRFGNRVVSAFGYSNDAAGRRTAISRSGETFGDLSGATDAYGYNSRREIFSAALSALPIFAQGEVRSGMNASTTYTVKHIQLLTLLPHKLDLAHSFKEEGTWNGEVSIDCCDNGKGGKK